MAQRAYRPRRNRGRVATLTLGFEGLDAELATTAAWFDNEPSLAVARALGYREPVPPVLRAI